MHKPVGETIRTETEMPFHPTFGTWFLQFFWRAWLVAAALLGLAMVAIRYNDGMTTAVLGIAFMFAIIGPIGYLLHRLHHCTCPACGNEMKTSQDPTHSFWMARCSMCGKEWNLGVGVGHGD